MKGLGGEFITREERDLIQRQRPLQRARAVATGLCLAGCLFLAGATANHVWTGTYSRAELSFEEALKIAGDPTEPPARRRSAIGRLVFLSREAGGVVTATAMETADQFEADRRNWCPHVVGAWQEKGR